MMTTTPRTKRRQLASPPISRSAACLFTDTYSDASAKALQKETKRRLKLWKDEEKRDEGASFRKENV